MTEIREYLQPGSKQIVMDRAVVSGDFVLRSGVRATEKFEIDRIEDGSEELCLCVNGLVNCIEDRFRSPVLRRGKRYTFSAISSIANGATRLGQLVSREIDVRHIQSHKDENGDFYYKESFHEDDDVLLLDDVYSAGTNMEALTKKLPGNVRVVGGVVFLNRSHAPGIPQLSNGAPVHAVVREAL